VEALKYLEVVILLEPSLQRDISLLAHNVLMLLSSFFVHQ